MSETPMGDTPTQEPQANTPPAEVATPPAEDKSSQSVDDLKNELERANARAASAQREKEEADKRARDERVLRIRAEKKLAANGGGDAGDGSGEGNDATPGSAGSEAALVQAQAERDIYALVAGNPAYQELLGRDVTLKEMMSRSPLNLIPDYIDAEDAVDQMRKYLDGRLQASPDAPPASPAPSGYGANAPQPQAPANPPAPNAGEGANGDEDLAKRIHDMSPDEWAKLPEDKRRKMLQGDFSD